MRARQLVVLANAQAAVQRYLTEVPEALEGVPGLAREGGLQRAIIYRHSQAALAGGTIVSSLAHSRSIRAAACHVTVEWDAGTRVCCVNHFLRVAPAAVDDGPRQPLRLAILSIYQPCPKAGEALCADSGRMVENAELCALELDYINEALVTQKQPGAGRFGGDLLTLMPYGNTSKL